MLKTACIFQKKEVEAAFFFSVLLNLKHIYLYIAPAYFVYLLRSYCLSSTSDGRVRWHSFSVMRFLKLGLTVISVFAVSFGPFVMNGQLTQVRLTDTSDNNYVTSLWSVLSISSLQYLFCVEFYWKFMFSFLVLSLKLDDII